MKKAIRSLAAVSSLCLLAGCFSADNVDQSYISDLAIEAAGYKSTDVDDVKVKRQGLYWAVSFVSDAGSYEVDMSSTGSIAGFHFSRDGAIDANSQSSSDDQSQSAENTQEDENTSQSSTEVENTETTQSTETVFVLPEGSLPKKILVQKAAQYLGLSSFDADEFEMTPGSSDEEVIFSVDILSLGNRSVTLNPYTGMVIVQQ